MATAGVWGFIGVVIGGLLTVVGQATAESIKARVASRERTERREQAAREFQRATTIELQSAMAAYRRALAGFRLSGADAQIPEARASFELLLHRVASAPAREAVQAWAGTALLWFQGDDEGSAGDEDAAWALATRLTGEAIRATD